MTDFPCSRCHQPLTDDMIGQGSKEFPALVCPKCAKEIEEEQRKEGGEVKHIYLVFHCKTPECKMVHAVKYLGVKGQVEPDIPVAVRSPFVIECPKCHNPYNFRAEDLTQVEWPDPPPPDFRDNV